MSIIWSWWSQWLLIWCLTLCLVAKDMEEKKWKQNSFYSWNEIPPPLLFLLKKNSLDTTDYCIKLTYVDSEPLKICLLVMKIYFQNVSFCMCVFKWVIIINWYLILVFQWSVKNGGGEDCDCERCYWSKTFKSLP